MQHVVHVPHGTKLPDCLLVVCITDWRKVGQRPELGFGQGCRQATLQFSSGIQDDIQSSFVDNCISSIVSVEEQPLQYSCWSCGQAYLELHGVQASAADV